MASGADAIKSLVAQVAAPAVAPTPQAPPAPQGLPVGTRAPAVRLQDLDDREVALADFRRRPTLVRFWNPGCGFGQRMLPDLKAWEAAAGAEAPQLLVVSTGAAEANRAMGLRSPVVLDQTFQTGRAFGSGDTPSAVLVSADGTIAAPVAVGADAVLALAHSPRAQGAGALAR